MTSPLTTRGARPLTVVCSWGASKQLFRSRKTLVLSHVSPLCTEPVLWMDASCFLSHYCQITSSLIHVVLLLHTKPPQRFIPYNFLSLSSCIHPMSVHFFEPTVHSYVHVFVSSLQLLHRLPPFADMQNVYLCLYRQSVFLSVHIPTRLCLFCLVWNIWMPDAALLFWRIRMVLWSPKSLNFSAFTWMKSGFVDFLWVVSFTIIVAVFKSMNICSVFVLYVPPHFHTVWRNSTRCIRTNFDSFTMQLIFFVLCVVSKIVCLLKLWRNVMLLTLWITMSFLKWLGFFLTYFQMLFFLFCFFRLILS